MHLEEMLRCRIDFTRFFCSPTCSSSALFSKQMESAVSPVESSQSLLYMNVFWKISRFRPASPIELTVYLGSHGRWNEYISVYLSEHYAVSRKHYIPLCTHWPNAHIWLWVCFSDYLISAFLLWKAQIKQSTSVQSCIGSFMWKDYQMSTDLSVFEIRLGLTVIHLKLQSGVKQHNLLDLY